jgi:hypothetical protein
MLVVVSVSTVCGELLIRRRSGFGSGRSFVGSCRRNCHREVAMIRLAMTRVLPRQREIGPGSASLVSLGFKSSSASDFSRREI